MKFYSWKLKTSKKKIIFEVERTNFKDCKETDFNSVQPSKCELPIIAWTSFKITVLNLIYPLNDNPWIDIAFSIWINDKEEHPENASSPIPKISCWFYINSFHIDIFSKSICRNKFYRYIFFNCKWRNWIRKWKITFSYWSYNQVQVSFF